MNAINVLAQTIATAVQRANNTSGMAERGVIKDNMVVTSHGVYSYELVCPINVYDGREVWVQIAADNSVAVVIG